MVVYHFDLGEDVNKQNCRIWRTEKPHAYIEKPTHGDGYRAMLNQFLFTKIKEKDIGLIGWRYGGWKQYSMFCSLFLHYQLRCNTV